MADETTATATSATAAMTSNAIAGVLKRLGLGLMQLLLLARWQCRVQSLHYF